MPNSLWPHGLQPTRLLCPWNSAGKNSGTGWHSLLHGIFPTQGSNPCLLSLLHRQAGSLPLARPGKPSTSIPHFKHSPAKPRICQDRDYKICLMGINTSADSPVSGVCSGHWAPLRVPTIQDRGLQPVLSWVVSSALSAQESTPRHGPQSKAAALPKLTALPWVIRA